MKTKEHYKRVYINSKEDLPNEISIPYFVMYKDGTYCKDKRMNPLDPTNMRVWTSLVDWYLLPVSQEPEHKTAEEMADKLWEWLSEQKYDDEGLLHAAVCCDFVGMVRFKKALADRLQKFASQSKSFAICKGCGNPIDTYYCNHCKELLES